VHKKIIWGLKNNYHLKYSDMKKLLFLIQFSSISLCLYAQSHKNENIARDFSFKDTNYVYIGIVNKFNLERKKLEILRITSKSNGISSYLYDTYFEISPKHEGVFTVTLESQKKKYNILVVAKRVSIPGS